MGGDSVNLRAGQAGRLETMLRPRSMAIVGATERSVWFSMACGNLKRFAFSGPLHFVNRKGGMIYGQQAHVSCVAIGAPVDLALVMVPIDAMQDAIRDIAAANIPNAVVLTAGFAEAGAAGARHQAELVAAAKAAGISLLGPNCLGFANYIDRVPVWTTQIRKPREQGSIALVSQSGAVAANILAFAQQQGIQLTHVISTGNEADVDVAEILEFLISQPQVKAIAIFMESVRDAGRFQIAAGRARAADKPLVVLKVGRSEITAAAAQAHTGSLVGDDRVFDAACRRSGMIRVSSPEELVVTTDIMSKLGRIERPGLALVAMSGGMCEIGADLAGAEGASLPRLAPESVTALRAILPEYGTPNNPLDLTGAAMLKLEIFENSVTALARDPAIGAILGLFDAPHRIEGSEFVISLFGHIGAAFTAAPVPCLLTSNALSPLTEDGKTVAANSKVAYSGAGLSYAIKAMTHAAKWWSYPGGCQVAETQSLGGTQERPTGEREVLDYLARHGVPVIPAVLARSRDEAVNAAAAFASPSVLKIASVDIAHKSDIGGVVLNLAPPAVGQAYDELQARVRAARPDAIIDGVIVSPMREPGLELFVGTTRDPQWGPAIVVGLGGIWVEALQDTSLRLLPVTPADVLEMLAELRGAKLLDGFRGAPAADRTAIAQAISRIGDAVLALGADLVSLEINPLTVRGGSVEALDGLAVWDPPH